MTDPAALTPCPTCGLPLGLPTREWSREPVPHWTAGDPLPSGVSKIAVTCGNGHRWTAQSHTWSLDRGHWYEGLAPDRSHDG